MGKTKADKCSAQFAEVVAEWQRRLLQLDRRNNLLNFKLSMTTVHIIQHTPDSILDALLKSRHGLTFDYAEPISREQINRFTKADAGEEQKQEPYILTGDLRGDCPPLELQRRLGNLRRRAREWEEEQGLNILFLALGFLQWIDEDGEQLIAPLLLLPCHLERNSPRAAFILVHDEEEPATNSTLAVKLNEFDIQLPEIDSGTETAIAYIDAVRKLVEKRPEWKVQNDIYLATFAYSKLAMWRDLEIIKKNGTEHTIVRTLAGEKPAIQEDTTSTAHPIVIPDDLSGAKLDDILDVRDHFAILPADYSQLLAITAARSGYNLVVHGPPGTGKSQTIANIIATFLAEGKSTLFVSEKTAALDVVKRRLDDKELGVFCLDLHSERGRKANVYLQLKQSVDDRRAIRRQDFDYEQLTDLRNRLNAVVRALHQIREPLGYSIFQVHGRYASIRDVPHVSFKVKNIEKLSQKKLNAILEVANRVRLRHREFREYWTSHWRILKSGTPSLELANKIRNDMQRLASAVDVIQNTTLSLTKSLGLSTPETLDEFTKVKNIVQHFTKATGIPQKWLQCGVVSRLRDIAKREVGLQTERADLINKLTSILGSPIPDWDFKDLVTQLTIYPEEQLSLNELFEKQWSQKIVQSEQVISVLLREIVNAITRLRAAVTSISNFLQETPSDTWTDIHTFLSLTKTLANVAPVPNEWTEPQGTEKIIAIVQKAQKLAQDLEAREKDLFSEFEPDIIDLVDEKMLLRYRTTYQSPLRRFISRNYWSDRKRIQMFRHAYNKVSFAQEAKIVEEILKLKKKRKTWEELAVELESALGTRCAGRNTEWDIVLRHLHNVQEILKGLGKRKTHIPQLLTEEDTSRYSQELSNTLEQVSAELQALLDDNLDSGLVKQIKKDKISLLSLENLALNAITTTERIENKVRIPITTTRKEIKDLQALQLLMSWGARLCKLEQEHLQVQETMQANFEARFKGFDTDWTDIFNCLTWAEDLLINVSSNELTPTLLSKAEQPEAQAIYIAMAKSATDVLQQFMALTKSLKEDYDLQGGPWESWPQAKFDQIKQWSKELFNDADSASDWLLFQATIGEFDQIIGPDTVELIRCTTEESELIPRIIERRVLGEWIDYIYKQESLLSRFMALEHGNIISKFKELDTQLSFAAQNMVRKKVYERYPNSTATSAKGSALGILRGELSKRRRQWPVRKLFRTIPHLIKTLKPCIMVSPLAISQFLPFSEVESETLSFDVVIFDEASQIFPEDAIPAILRGNQLILAGDQKQLPPSSFWRHSLEEEFDFDEESEDTMANLFAGRESILDAAVQLEGQLFNPAKLNVHYRSRDESLIRFSNHHFYEDYLLTFPSPRINNTWYGVHDIFVPDGRYDAGATCTNRKEADRVVDLVFEHLRTRPVGESLGVVALSRSQSDLIERLIEERRILERDLDERFNERKDEPIFIKNLENVQGDERDHMIISIGYGPTVESGATPNRFGPLNIEGGERRLNVVISRARQRVDLVHSLKASDIHSQQQGAKFLKLYLEYAADPNQYFEGHKIINPTAEPESPFEAAVQQALIARGYKVSNQVGAAGYSIDLAVLSESGDKCDLGIECDGWVYHSAPAARDRDWLRQQVLEGLGWKIHRVWSTAWIRNPKAELERIEKAIAVARAGTTLDNNLAMFNSSNNESSLEALNSDENLVEINPQKSIDIHLEKYEKANIPRSKWDVELRNETTERLIRIIYEVAKIEGPLHKNVSY